MSVDLKSPTLTALNTQDLTRIMISQQSLAHEEVFDPLSRFVQSKCLNVSSTKTGITQKG